ncbi:putative protein kinase RLK-Pelle-LRR-Xb-1 family [Rosa chinensis]|uniref:Protein kinase domain-containing protein n=1 Tax=Rosa chinensis TaxID=74649 RepID=A0A2P6Q4A0_ROSCH|nr:putative protein kinase RLK-Pelle-LRR-Xb-1 family [Rosa chinensis]
MEFVGMVCLDFYLHQNPDGASLLDWNHRLKIAAGAARGLQYLHEGVAPNIVHGCVKASNILLDVKFCARVCDYGLSFLAPKEKRGLVGYVDDDGRRCDEGFLVKWAMPLIQEMRFSEFLDPRLVIPHDIRPLVRLTKVASTCVSNSRKSIPSISQVTTILNNLVIDST